MNALAFRRFNLWDGEDPSKYVTYGHWDESEHGRWFQPDYLAGSDYSGSLVERSKGEPS